ncbi:hypothetical protein G6F68_011506 [Rhizopus microsporus]|nr:hypothetical protein G6F68_011506 [Rhizopus microsporus]
MVLGWLLISSRLGWWKKIAAQPRALPILLPGLLHQSAGERAAGRAGTEGTPAPPAVGGGGDGGSGRGMADHRCRHAAVDRAGPGLFVRAVRAVAQAGLGRPGGWPGRGEPVPVPAGAGVRDLGRERSWRCLLPWLGLAQRPAADLRRRGHRGTADRLCLRREAHPAVAGRHPAVHRAEPAAAAGRVLLPVHAVDGDAVGGDIPGDAHRQRGAGIGAAVGRGRVRFAGRGVFHAYHAGRWRLSAGHARVDRRCGAAAEID